MDNNKEKERKVDIMNSKCLDYIALIITIIGAINWGLIGFFSFDLIAWIFGDMSWLSRIIYAIVGICGLYLISFLGRIKTYNSEE